MAVDGKTVEQAADELYALPPADFTRARDERAKALRKEGRRDEADAVKALRKPTVAAWALNQLARRRAKDVERLVAAGEELRAAQEELLAGGDRKAFQSAAAKEREQVAKLAGEATELVSEAGERASPALQEKISETLHAAALDEDTAEELRAGRLVREREAIGGFGGVMAAPPARAAGGRRRVTGRRRTARVMRRRRTARVMRRRRTAALKVTRAVSGGAPAAPRSAARRPAVPASAARPPLMPASAARRRRTMTGGAQMPSAAMPPSGGSASRPLAPMSGTPSVSSTRPPRRPSTPRRARRPPGFTPRRRTPGRRPPRSA